MNEAPTHLAAPSVAALSQGTGAPAPATGALGIPSFDTMDRLGHAVTARMTQGVSPHALYAAWFDWASHLARAPGRQLELGIAAAQIATLYTRFVAQTLSGANPPSPFHAQQHDRRFQHEAWTTPPLLFWQQAYLAQ